MKTVGSRNVKTFELDEYSIQIAYAHVSIEELKKIAQKARERQDWYGHDHKNDMILKVALSTIHLQEPNFKTQFIPAS